jgi:hypothetical protein
MLIKVPTDFLLLHITRKKIYSGRRWACQAVPDLTMCLVWPQPQFGSVHQSHWPDGSLDGWMGECQLQMRPAALLAG